MSEENIAVSMKLSPKKAGKLYMNWLDECAENEKLNDRLKQAYCKEIGADSIVGLDSCDDYKDWLNA